MLTNGYIKRALLKLTNYSYEELYVLVEFVEESQECSFGSDYEDDYDPELTGDIEIGDDLTLEEKYYSLLHEMGHAVLHAENREYDDTILLETSAWCEGLRIANHLKLKINEEKFKKQMLHALDLYREVINDNNR